MDGTRSGGINKISQMKSIVSGWTPLIEKRSQRFTVMTSDRNRYELF